MKKFKSVSEECENIHLKLNQVKPHRGGQTPPIDLGPSSLSFVFAFPKFSVPSPRRHRVADSERSLILNISGRKSA